MFLLALDTSSPNQSCCLLQDGITQIELSLRAGPDWNTDPVTLIGEALRLAGTPLSKVDALACTLGPGSFTGLRVGLSVMKGLAAPGVPLFGVSTLRALAGSATSGGAEVVVACLDARREELYAAAYQGKQMVIPEGVYSPAQLAEALASLNHQGPWLWVGDGVRRHAAQFPAAMDPTSAPLFDAPRPGAVAILAYERWLAGERPDAAGLVPEYLRAPEAERKRLALR